MIKIYASAAGRVTALRGVDLAVDHGALVALVGPSGSGKSSLLRIIAGLDQASAGTVSVAGVDFAAVPRRQRRVVRSRLLSHVYQRPGDNLLAHLDAVEQVQRVARHRGATDDDAVAALERVGLANRAHHRPDELSGGEQQRLALARAIVGSPALVIADEPTAELDTESTLAVIEVIRELNAEGATILMATHDPLALDHVDHVIELRDGTVARIRRDGRDRAVIDGAGRLHLPHEVDRHFPDRTALIEWDDDGDQLVGRP